MIKFSSIISFFLFLFILNGCGGGSDDESTEINPQPDPNPPTGNTKPVASSISLTIESSARNQQITLIGSDADGDTLQYQFTGSSSGAGYTSVSLSNNILYVTLTSNFTGTITLPYRVTDGIQFSDTANVVLTVTSSVENLSDYGKGLILVDPKDYTQFGVSDLSGTLFGAPGQEPALPSRIDLSSNFPTSSNQGAQGSCVGWATAYALKSYQERIEEGWSLNSESHLFSPAFIYNELRGYDGQCNQGTYIHEALTLIKEKGAATLATMPYDQSNCSKRPSSAAVREAAQYKAASFDKVNGSQGIKAALANRLPVVGGIMVYDSFESIANAGKNAVYNSMGNGQFKGGHAVTIVGYDDSKYGGAYKVINSWGANWGDNGYFWLPYSFAASSSTVGNKILSEAYVLNDADNTGTTPNPDPDPSPSENLPNLIVSNWEAHYDATPGGSGELIYEVTNTGNVTASSGFNVNLVLSQDQAITPNDIYVVYEPSAYSLDSGDVLYRDEQSSLPFKFPTYIRPGTYYMAVWVDDTNVVRESNERDNASFGDNTFTIKAAGLPDLYIQSWYAEWDDYTGNGTLQYTVGNKGDTASGNWWTGLILAQADNFYNATYLLYAERITSQLGASRTLSLTRNINVFNEIYGKEVPSGTYYMYLWADYVNDLRETNDNNNWSYSNDPIYIGSYRNTRDKTLSTLNKKGTVSVYNGKPLPVAKIHITNEDSGMKSILSSDVTTAQEEVHVYEKVVKARDKLVLPISNKFHADIQRNFK